MLDSRFWGVQQLVCVPHRKPGLATLRVVSGAPWPCLGLDQHTPCAKSGLLPKESEQHKARCRQSPQGRERGGDLIAHLSIYLRSCLDIINQQTDFPLSLISPDPKLLKFNQSGNTRPLSEISKSSNSYQHHVFCFP